MKYGGELEMGDAGNRGKVDAYTRLLVPILVIQKELGVVHALVRDDNKVSIHVHAGQSRSAPSL